MVPVFGTLSALAQSGTFLTMSANTDTTHGDLFGPETFTSTVTFGQLMTRMGVTLVMLFLISAVMFGLILANLGVPGGFVVGVVLAVPFCALMVRAKKRQFESTLGQQTVTFSPDGAVMSDPYSRVELPWAHVRSIGQVEMMRPIRTPGQRDKLVVAAVSGIASATQGTHEHGLVGAGVLTTSPDAPRLLKAQVKQFLNDGPADPLIGQRPMGIPLLRFNRDWQSGRIGEWVRSYRPDLLG